MYKKSLILVVIILFYSCKTTTRESVKTWIFEDSDVEFLNGAVKQIKVTYDDPSFIKSIDYTVVNVDKAGNVTSVESGFHGNNSTTTYVSKYNAKGGKVAAIAVSWQAKDFPRIMKERKNIKTADTIVKPTELYEYDGNGYIKKYILNRNDPSGVVFQYKYNDNGDVIECDGYKNPNFLDEITQYLYDGQRNLKEVDILLGQHTLQSKTTYENMIFDSYDNWTKTLRHTKYCIFGGDDEIVTVNRKITYY